jgi:hypothetical protein
MGWTYQEYLDQPKWLLEAMAIDAEAENAAQELAMDEAKQDNANGR